MEDFQITMGDPLMGKLLRFSIFRMFLDTLVHIHLEAKQTNIGPDMQKVHQILGFNIAVQNVNTVFNRSSSCVVVEVPGILRHFLDFPRNAGSREFTGR